MPEGYDINWIAVLLVAGVGLAAMGALFGVSYILAPKRYSEQKEIPYECGIPPRSFHVVADKHSLLRVRDPLPDIRRGGGLPVSLGDSFSRYDSRRLL